MGYYALTSPFKKDPFIYPLGCCKGHCIRNSLLSRNLKRKKSRRLIFDLTLFSGTRFPQHPINVGVTNSFDFCQQTKKHGNMENNLLESQIKVREGKKVLLLLIIHYYGIPYYAHE